MTNTPRALRISIDPAVAQALQKLQQLADASGMLEDLQQEFARSQSLIQEIWTAAHRIQDPYRHDADDC